MIRKAIPHLFTLGNLFCGVFGIILAFNENLVGASLLIGIAVVFDFLDGFIARMLGVQGEFGKQLDSLADMVTSGVLPGIILFQLVTAMQHEYFTDFDERTGVWVAALTLIVPLFAALRLAKFNIDTKQSDEFLGLPTPASALFVASFPLILEWQFRLNFYYPPAGQTYESVARAFRWDGFERWLSALLLDPYFYVGMAVVLSALMVIRMPLLSFKFKSFAWKANRIRYIFLILVGLCILSLFVPYWRFVNFYFPEFEYAIIPIILLLYLLISIVNNLIRRAQ